jgi:sugar lactone lactonase YvrE
VSRLTQKGVNDGLESESNGLVYAGSVEQNAVVIFNPESGTTSTYVRYPQLRWIDTFSIWGGDLYLTETQLWRTPGLQGGVDKRAKPFVLWRVPLADGGEDFVAVGNHEIPEEWFDISSFCHLSLVLDIFFSS